MSEQGDQLDAELAYGEPAEGVDDQHDDQIDTSTEDQDDGEGEDLDADASLEEDEYDEIERGDKKYRVPKALVPELMLQADYTRKTQELAEARKAVEAEAASQRQVSEEVEAARFKVRAVSERLAQFDALTEAQWAQIEAADLQNGTNEAQRLLREHHLLRTQKADAENTLKTTESEALEKQRQTDAKLIEQGNAILARDIKGWGPELALKIATFAETKHGISREELGAVRDPRYFKVLHSAMQWDAAQAAKMAQVRGAKAQDTKPASKVAGRGNPTTGLSDSLSDAEYFRRRQEQLSRQRSQPRAAPVGRR